MNIKFIKKTGNTGDFITLIYEIDEKVVRVEIGGTALSILEIMDKDDIGIIFEPVVTDIYVKLDGQNASVKKIVIDSRGAMINGKIICTINDCKSQLLIKKIK